MSRISNAMLDELLDEISDYDFVHLSQPQIRELEDICDQWEDKESIENEINRYLQKHSYMYNDEDCIWENCFELFKAVINDWLDEVYDMPDSALELKMDDHRCISWGGAKFFIPRSTPSMASELEAEVLEQLYTFNQI